MTVIALSIVAAVADGRQGGASGAVRVAAASDLKYAFDEVMARLTKRHPGLRIEAVYGSSGNFHAQLGQRAPFDLFLSADVEYPRDLVKRGVAVDRDLFTYATGHLVLWVPSTSPLLLDRDGLRAVTRARRVAIANPRHAPYGRAARAALEHARLWDQVQPRLVLGDNIAQTAQFAETGAADAALIAKSLATAPAMRAKGRYIEIAAATHPPLVQGGLILPWARSREAAMLVRDYLLGTEGRTLLQSYGFGLPG